MIFCIYLIVILFVYILTYLRILQEYVKYKDTTLHCIYRRKLEYEYILCYNQWISESQVNWFFF